jgi:hypothetical protein
MVNYVVCIPSYHRAQLCNDKTLTMLQKNKIPRNKIYVYVANKEEYDIYKETLDKDKYGTIVVGKPGLVPQRQFIMEQWPEGKPIVFFDDDVECVDFSLSPRFKRHNLEFFFNEAFNDCKANDSYIWGVYAVFNPFFRKPRPEMSTSLKYIVGAFYGIINRPRLSSIKLTITKENGQKEDVERTIKYFLTDGIVLRYNKVGFKTKYYGKEGGLGTFEARIPTMREACEKLNKAYPELGNIKYKKTGMCEYQLKNIKSTKIQVNNGKTKKNGGSSNKTRRRVS